MQIQSVSCLPISGLALGESHTTVIDATIVQEEGDSALYRKLHP